MSPKRKNETDRTPPPPIREIAIMEILFRQTDAQHRLTRDQIAAMLKERGLDVTPRTVSFDILSMKETHGFGITTSGKSPVLYAWENRPLPLSVVNTLVQMVNASPSLSGNSKYGILKMMAALCNDADADRILNAAGSSSAWANGDIDRDFTNLNLIKTAIERKWQVSFLYYERDANGKIFYHNNEKPYIVSPYALTWKNDKCYLLAHYAPHNVRISHFRADGLMKVTLLPNLEDSEKPNLNYVPPQEGFDPEEYIRSLIDMFGGPMKTVTLKCKASVLRPVRDQFGDHAKIEPLKDGTFKLTHTIGISPTFFGWVCQFGGGVRILETEEEIERKASEPSVADQYEDWLIRQLRPETRELISRK